LNARRRADGGASSLNRRFSAAAIGHAREFLRPLRHSPLRAGGIQRRAAPAEYRHLRIRLRSI